MGRVRRVVVVAVLAVLGGLLVPPSASAAEPTFSIESVTSFAPAQVDGGTSRGDYRIRNTGDVPLDLTGGVRVEGADFSLAPGSSGGNCTVESPVVQPGYQCIVEIRFSPVAEGIREGLLVISPSGGEAQQVPLSSFGQPYDGLTVQPSSMSFAATATLYDEKVVMIDNPSGRPTRLEPLRLTGPYTVDTPFCQSEADPFGTYLGADGVVPPNTRCGVRVTFRPTTAGSFPGELVVASDASPEPERVALAGEAIATGPIPTITSSSPESGPARGGTVVRVRGTNLDAVTSVYLGSNGDETHSPYSTGPAFTVSKDGRTLTFRTARNRSDARGRIIVYTATDISAESPRPFTYVRPGPPTITAVSPASVPQKGGVRVRVTGTELSWAEVFLDGQYVPRDASTNDAALTFVAPAHAPGPADLRISSGYESDAAPQTLTYSATPAPRITASAPSTGPSTGNTAVRLTGTDLTDVRTVTVGGAEVSFTAATNGRSVSFRTPAHAAGGVPVVVTTAAGSSDPVTFTYTPPPAPTVTALSPTAGPVRGNTAVKATGTDLIDVRSVTVGGTSVAFTAATNGRSLTFRTPPHAAGAVPVVVTTGSGASAPSSYTYR